MRRKPFELLCAGAFKLRGLLIAPLVVFMLTHYDARWEHDWLEWVAGSTLFSLGVLIRVTAQRHLRYRLQGQRRLARSGLYRYVRNPVYLANVLVLIGLALASELPWLVPLTAGWAGLVYHLATLFEEGRLELRYGDEYRIYCRQVPRWLPRSTPVGSVSRTSSTPWHRVFAVEWPCMLMLLVPVAKEVVEHLWPALLV
jgi:protein-S-isoprenylcysteine O-methyltransferase Ste14